MQSNMITQNAKSKKHNAMISRKFVIAVKTYT